MLTILMIVLLILFLAALVSASLKLFVWAIHAMGILGVALVVVFVLWLLS